ncbi:MAG: Mth938-like domain-containing protein [Rhodospirillales bacterium]
MRITVYDFGRIVVDGETHTRDVIIHPGRVEGEWWRKEGHRLDVDDLAHVWDSEPQTLVVGTGYHGNMVIPQETADYVRAKGIEILAARTPDAVAEFNRLAQEPGRRVVAALHLTC